jgi:hypothetical protein
MYVAAIFQTINASHLELRIKEMLGPHREIPNAEMYNLHYTSLYNFIDYLNERFNDEINLHKKKLEELIFEVLNTPPVIPEPIIINGTEYRAITYENPHKLGKINIDEMPRENLETWLKEIFQKFSESIEGIKIIKRKILFEKMESELGIRFDRRKMWIFLKSYSNLHGITVSY